MMNPGGNVTRKYKAKPRAKSAAREIPIEQLCREAERGLDYFWGKRGGRPAGSSFGDKFIFGKQTA